jgi:GTP-binding protein HflX
MIVETEKKRERALAVSVGVGARTREEAIEHLDELEFLAETAGAEIIEKIYQDRDKPDGGTVVGKGKLEEIKASVESEEIQLVIFDNDLTPAQVRNLENELKVKIMDRSGIILDIFAQRAKSNEAKLQVELAQLQYMLPRLTRMWTHLSKQYGGMGTKGPGETQIETDRRLVRDRISHLKEKLETIARQKETQRKGRDTHTRFALVGYTNAGKSTLMRVLSGADVYVEDKLFATLDTTVRKIELGHNTEALLSDTVGFIRKLPTHLVASFRSTLAETLEADVLLHVVDISHPAYAEHLATVESTLSDLGVIPQVYAHDEPINESLPAQPKRDKRTAKTYPLVQNKKMLMVFNKIDEDSARERLPSLLEKYPNAIGISAIRNINIVALKEKMFEIGQEFTTTVEFLFPYSAMKDIGELYRHADISERHDEDEGIRIFALMQRSHPLWSKFAGYVVR